MIRCKACAYENNDGNKFCMKCGTKLEVEAESKPLKNSCPNCGEDIQDKFKFCKHCGYKIDASQNDSLIAESHKVKAKMKKWPFVLLGVLFAIILLLSVGIFLKQNGVLGEKWNQDNVEEDSDEGAIERKDTKETGPDPNVEPEDTNQSETDSVYDTSAQAEADVNYDYPILVPVKAMSSSVLSGGDYDVDNLLDGNVSTAWVEGDAGTGVGEYVQYTLNDTNTKVYGIAVIPGYMKSKKVYDDNAVPTSLKVTIGEYEEDFDIDSFTPDFTNISENLIYLNFSEPMEADEVMVRINDTKLGKKYNDTCISEMYLFTYPVIGEEYVSEPIGSLVYEKEEYILENSDSTYLTMSDLEGLTKEECRLARNELYARHGRKFDDKDMQSYFASQDWYEGTISPKKFDDSVLNEYEIANRDLIVEFEEEQGYSK